MPEKLLTLKETAAQLGLNEEEVKRLVAVGEIPAYKVGGTFLRFRKEQIDAISKEIVRVESSGKHDGVRSKDPVARAAPEAYDYSFFERIGDFLYFNDFYILSFSIIGVLLYLIFK
ncbi:MAG: helix-turn-helix domain-containing protein [Candidatus Omnitrophota bacterium]